MNTVSKIASTTLLALACAGAVNAQSQGDWTIGVGVGGVLPKSGNGTLAGGEADIGNDVRPTLTVEYFLRDNIGIELLAAAPFEHDINIAGVGFAGTTKHLPPTLSLNYHIPTDGPWKPYVGAGINYTAFFDEESPLGTLSLDNSWGLSVQAGIDYEVSPNAAVRANIRWIDIDTDARLNGAAIGTANIDPIVLNFAYVFRF